MWWITFWTEYVRNGNNGTEAYLAAKPAATRKTAEVESYKLLRKPVFLDWRQAHEDAQMSRADRWQREQLERCQRYRGDLDTTRKQFDPGDGTAVIDPVAIKCMTQAEETNDRIARRCLNLDREKAPAAVNINVFTALGNAREKLIEDAEVLSLPQPDKVIDCDIG